MEVAERILGHKSIENTIVYITLDGALLDVSSDEFTVRVASTLGEACQLVEAGFEYVTDVDGSKIFPHRK